MKTLQVRPGTADYPIHIGSGLLADAELLRGHIRGEHVFIVSNPVVAEHYLDPLCRACHGLTLASHLVPDGEAWKTLDTLDAIIGAMLRTNQHRDTTVIALGGGVVGDMAGFAAATFQRGVDLIQVPTTLLAQVDSSVGGKTAVNHALGKNMIGAFHQPQAVIIDTDTLATLPQRQRLAGIAEIVKHGLLEGEAAFALLEAQFGELLALDPAILGDTVYRNCRYKADVVAADEKEHGQRALLNLGHTFGHAIETGSGHGTWLHGEAVAAGLVLAADLSMRLGRLDAAFAQRIRALIERIGLPVRPPAWTTAKWLQLMAVDKKVRGGRLRFILLDGPGQAIIDDNVATEVLAQTLQAGDRLCTGGAA